MTLRDKLFERYSECRVDAVMEMVIDHLINTAIEIDENFGFGWTALKDLVDGPYMDELDLVVVPFLKDLAEGRLKALSRYVLVKEMPELDVDTPAGRDKIADLYAFFADMGFI